VETIPENVLDWLLERENPSVRYRTMKELQNIPLTDKKMIETHQSISQTSTIKKIKKAMHPEGYWTVKKPDGRVIGAGVEYATFNTTHYVLGYVAELGLTREEPWVELAADRYLSLQASDEEFYNYLSCLMGLNLRTFAKLGFGEDSRLLKSISLLESKIRYENGYLCDLHEGKRKRGQLVKSCFRGSVKALYGLSEFPQYWQKPFVKDLVNYFLNREILFKTTNLMKLVRKDVILTYFPFTYHAGLIDVIYPLCKMGYGSDKTVQRAWEILEKHRAKEGKYILEQKPKNRYLDPGERDQPNKWITFYSYLCKILKEGSIKNFESKNSP
jgi:hypothetical protein